MSNTAKEQSKTNGKLFLQQSFAQQQAMLECQLKLSRSSITHNATMGNINEKYFIDMIKNYLPDRYAIDTGIVIDSEGKTSDQIDIIIFDNQYTPTLLDQNDHRYIPAESVYAIFEVKPHIDKNYIKYAGNKAKSVRILKRTSVSIVHAGGIYPAKKHFDIIAGIIAIDIKWDDGFGNAFKNVYNDLTDTEKLNCGLAINGDCFDTYNDGEFTFGPYPNSLIFFLFRLLEKLQSLGTVPAIDWNAYAEQLKS